VDYKTLVKDGAEHERVSTACLADLGNAVSIDSEYARDGFPIGAPIFRSPEAALRIPWGCATDIWSLGTTVSFYDIIDSHPPDSVQLISLIWGLNWHIFKPSVPIDHEDYELEIMMKHCQYFGPYPLSYQEIADLDRQNVLANIMNTVRGATSGKDSRKPFYLIREKEISREDRAFLGKMMRLDPRDRPTARELLRDEWFEDEGDDFPSGGRMCKA
jgi:serine/threonine protein kinase